MASNNVRKVWFFYWKSDLGIIRSLTNSYIFKRQMGIQVKTWIQQRNYSIQGLMGYKKFLTARKNRLPSEICLSSKIYELQIDFCHCSSSRLRNKVNGYLNRLFLWRYWGRNLCSLATGIYWCYLPKSQLPIEKSTLRYLPRTSPTVSNYRQIFS